MRMKTHLSTLLTATAVLTGTISPASAAEPKFKADVPQSLIPPDKVQTEFLGELNFTDGMPSEDTVKKTYDFLDLSRAVDSFLNGIPYTSIYVTVAFALPADLLTRNASASL